MEPLTPAARRNLRAKAHHLEPVVTIGHHGLTPQVLHEIDVALLAHELIKVKVLGDDRAARATMLDAVAKALDCAPVQHVGKVLVLWRPNPEKVEKRPADMAATTPGSRAARASSPARERSPRAAQKTPVDAVRARRRGASTPWGAAPATTGKGRRGAARHAMVTPATPAAPSTRPAATRRRRTRGT